MDIKIIQSDNKSIAIVQSNDILIKDTQSALDFIATISYETECYRIALNKEAITEDFFKLSTRLAGEILQKFVNYNVKLAIIGDFTCYLSKSLKDFIYESNKGKHIFFVFNKNEAIEKLSM
ncbi:DUF4180 domain-containing protein [Clostridium kluyveri]|uniref:DUF4180 domain-containing protein n=1 Tax=Clostridium kluyveri TaxID=1534 RepID=UPI00224811BE|nr:DUF4180 domain-containing protein [Clostridium kluyveri]UZQ51145.1 DUF4180 domain-containing protein [Clostridium kluyveri]